MTKQSTIVPVLLADTTKQQPSTPTQKQKVACQLKIKDTTLHIYNGANPYILTTILKELTSDAR